MAAIATADLLTAWERGSSQSGSRRLLTLLAAMYPEIPEQQLLKLPIGQRDGLALELREILFGSQLISLSVCPSCSERLELALDVADIKVASNGSTETPLTLEAEGFELRFRLPDSQDLMFIEAVSSIDAARRILLQRCLLSASRNGQLCALEQLPEQILDNVDAAMSAADPQADVQLDLSCPACQHSWLATFDIASFLWSEISAWAQRVLNEVHLLAKAYCWCEADILAMSPARRRFYLERVLQ
ncbi:MAG: hypothetical protein PSU93_00275 [Methylobacter sp.]|uniref:Phage baseplate protein n=1 Tax=Candidatus Methylobacter titanis TaxID=3053457 RepID=A0AA43TIT1_9GAMM|nr:hypothetical protein [Candidatus Methylobacter titanis]